MGMDDERTVRAEIEKASSDLLEAVNDSNVEGVARLWRDDGVLMPPHQPRVEGHESIRFVFRTSLLGFAPPVSVHLVARVVRV